jgi:hypothetical protein
LREVASIGPPLGVGALALILGGFLVVLGVLLLFLGTGAGMATAMAYAPVLYFSQIFVGTWLGNKIMGEPPMVTGAVIGRMAVGLLILDIARLIPFLGGLVALLVILWGGGAVLLGFYRMSRVEGAPSLPVSA